MKVIKPSYTIEHVTPNALRIIEAAGRTCYKSEGAIGPDSAVAFVRKVIAMGHESVLEHAHATVRFVCDRGVSHELVRHRIASFSQESTRYCNYSSGKFGGELTFILPCFWSEESEPSLHRYSAWRLACECAEKAYLGMIDAGASPQEARSVLPNSLKTEIVVTANFREWRKIFELRCASAAHPQMRELMIPLRREMRVLVPVVLGEEDE